jgi:hypothetical protein
VLCSSSSLRFSVSGMVALSASPCKFKLVTGVAAHLMSVMLHAILLSEVVCAILSLIVIAVYVCVYMLVWI